MQKCLRILLMLCMVFTKTFAQISFIKIPAGRYTIGQAKHAINPLKTIYLDSFYISTYEITNAQFLAFIQATHYLTDAQKYHNALTYRPGLPEFRWAEDSTAYWQYPNGKTAGDIATKMNHPVTCISYHDAQAYCQWQGVQLPSLTQWEVASLGGQNAQYFFGKNKNQIAQYANIWHGLSHKTPDSTDGYITTSPVGSFAPNPYGLYDIYGNVFEFCQGALPTDTHKTAHARGGSWWCSATSCSFFNSKDIGNVNPRASFSNLGFRVVKKCNK